MGLDTGDLSLCGDTLKANEVMNTVSDPGATVQSLAVADMRPVLFRGGGKGRLRWSMPIIPALERLKQGDT